MHTVIETPQFQDDAKRAGCGEDEIGAIVSAIAANPKVGDLIKGTGGARKVRFRRPGKGKSGGYRVITYFGGDDIPVFLIAMFAKGERANLSEAERNELRKILKPIADRYRGTWVAPQQKETRNDDGR